MAGTAGEAGNSPAPAQGLLRAKVLQGGTYLFFRQFISLGLSLLGLFIVSRLIGPEGYGGYAAALGIYYYLLNLSQIGVEVYLVRQRSVSEHEYDVAFTFLLASSLLAILLVEAAADRLAGWVQVDGFEPIVRVLICALIFQATATPATARLERELDYRRVAAIELTGQVCYYLLAVPLAFAGYGGWSLVVGWFAQMGTNWVLFQFAARYVPRLRFDRAIARHMLSFTFGFSLVTWTWWLRALINPLIVGHFAGTAAVAQIGMAVKLVEALTFVKVIAWRLSVATLSRLQDDISKLRAAINQGMQLQILALAPPLLGFCWLGDFVVPRALGPRWTPALEVFPFIAVSYLTNAPFAMHSSMLAVFRRNYEATLFNIVHVGLFAAASAVCVPRLGLVGYGWGEMAALASYLVLHVFAVLQVGAIDYRIAGLWWAGTVVGLFWHQVGIWAIAVPFVALSCPASVRQLRELYRAVRSSTGHLPKSREPAGQPKTTQLRGNLE
jgi:O-antigen/teichoic acid export membrane protein